MMKYSTSKGKCYTHFSREEREEIAIGLERGESIRRIAKKPGGSPSSVSREIRRNTPLFRLVRYRGNRAHQRAAARSRRSHARRRLENPVVRFYGESHPVNDGRTPEKIAGRLPVDHPGRSTNWESIYQWIYEERRYLITYLPKAHRKRHKRLKGKKNRAAKIPNRLDITGRPPEVERREEAGHWEADTVVFRQSKVCVAVLVERKTRYYLGFRMEDKSARSMS